MPLDLQQLSDRAEISDIVHAYARAVDTRDWALLASIFADPVTVDYSSFSPEVAYTLPVRELVEMIRVAIGGFAATQHLSGNHMHRLDGDRATCVSYVQATHLLDREGGQRECTLYGYYTNALLRTPAGWRIAELTLTVTGRSGDNGVFAAAAERVLPAR